MEHTKKGEICEESTMLKVRTLFSGIGSPESALKKLGVDFEIVDFCEIDKYAVKSYCAIHGVDECKNLGDILTVDTTNLPYADLLVWGFPCQDISVAGKQRGIQEGETRSGLYYEGFRILKETMPKYSIIENVKNLVGKSFKADFESMLNDIESIGYNNYWQVLNAKNYGIPQNRERVFVVNIRKDVDTGDFSFPEGFDNRLRLKDFLEDEVDEKFYISQEKTEKLMSQIKDKNQEISYCIDKSYNSPKPIEHANCITAREDRGISNHQAEGTAICIPCITPDREEKRQIKVVIDPYNCTLPKDQEAITTLRTNYSNGNAQIMQNYRIRKLTPKECWRLMGFTDEEFQKAQDAGVSNSQLYKQAGNSIVVDVLEYIFRNLLK